MMVDFVLQKAVRRNEPVEIIYMDHRAGVITQRLIRIYRLTAETVLAYCYERQAMRTFRRDRILAARRGELRRGSRQ